MYDWHWFAGRKKEAARWGRGDLRAMLTRHRSRAYIDVQVHLADGRMTWLTARVGFVPRQALRCARAIVDFAAILGTRAD